VPTKPARKFRARRDVLLRDRQLARLPEVADLVFDGNYSLNFYLTVRQKSFKSFNVKDDSGLWYGLKGE
jgi:hypothetical protein